MRIVADTNLLIASVFWSGAPYEIVQEALDGKLEIITSQNILNEMRKVLKDSKDGFELSEQEVDDIISGILLYTRIVDATVDVDVVRDPKDNHVVGCAVAAKADCIVTRDKDLLVVQEYEGIRIITPEEFLAFLRGP
mgnify:FL=1